MKRQKKLVLCSLLWLSCQTTFTPVFAEDELEVTDKTLQTGTDSVIDEINTDENIAEDTSQLRNSVKLSVLNKISGRSSELKVSENKTEIFGTLEISLLKCWRSPPDEQNESKALLIIWEKTPDEPKKLIFNGWMFSSTISISSLEHPIFDIIVEECM